jgi:acyl-CoA synthetase (AMP-forming)/AMP-acid ligase II
MPAPTLLDVFHRNDTSQNWNDVPALYIPGPPSSVRLTYDQLYRHCAHIANQLQQTLQLERGSIITLVLPNGPAFVATFLACTGLGWVAAPLNPAYNAEEIQFYLEDTGSRVVIVPAGWSAQGQPAFKAAQSLGCRLLEIDWQLHTADKQVTTAEFRLTEVKKNGTSDGNIQFNHIGSTLDVERASSTAFDAVWRAQPDDVALVLHTSGTTGRPKCKHTDPHMPIHADSSSYLLSPLYVCIRRPTNTLQYPHYYG